MFSDCGDWSGEPYHFASLQSIGSVYGLDIELCFSERDLTIFGMSLSWEAHLAEGDNACTCNGLKAGNKYEVSLHAPCPSSSVLNRRLPLRIEQKLDSDYGSIAFFRLENSHNTTMSG